MKHDKLLEALSRIGFPEVFLQAVRRLYQNPTLVVCTKVAKSSWRKQCRGTGQGCPLSLYLFIIVVIVMVRDIRDELNLSGGRLPEGIF